MAYGRRADSDSSCSRHAVDQLYERAAPVTVPAALFEELVRQAETAPFAGWDFSWLRGRAEEVRPPWDYRAEAEAALSRSHIALDIDTGGGEVLARLAPFNRWVVATEGYPPNIRIAAQRLVPLGVDVVGTESAPDNVAQYPLTDRTPASTSSHLPFRAETFDLVLDRHSSYWPSEVLRVLRSTGTFLTQQRSVGQDVPGLRTMFGQDEPQGPHYDLAFAVTQLKAEGFELVRAEEAETPLSFFDIGALVYYLRAVPWLVPGFTPERYREILLNLHQRIRAEGSVHFSGAHMLLVARRPA